MRTPRQSGSTPSVQGLSDIILSPTEVLETTTIMLIFEVLLILYIFYSSNYSYFVYKGLQVQSLVCAPLRQATSRLLITAPHQTSFYQEEFAFSSALASAAFAKRHGYTTIDFFMSFFFSFFSQAKHLRYLMVPLAFTFFNIIFFGLCSMVPSTTIMLTSVFPILAVAFSWLVYSFFLCISKYRLNAFYMFIPQGAPIYLLKFLIAIEFVSFFARFISLPARLIANAIAGHLLIKVLSCFCCVLLATSNLLCFVLASVPTLLCLVLSYLDVVVVFIQTFVFMFLLVFYLNQSFFSGVFSSDFYSKFCSSEVLYYSNVKDILFENRQLAPAFGMFGFFEHFTYVAQPDENWIDATTRYCSFT